VPDPQIPEAEEVLIGRAQVLHPDRTFPADFLSRFRKASRQAAPHAETSPAPVLTVELLPPLAAVPTAAAAAPAESAPVVASAPPQPAVADAAPKRVAPAVPAAAAAPVATTVGVALSTPTAGAAQKAPAAEPSKPAPARKPGETPFPGELAGTFDEVLAQLGTGTGTLPEHRKARVSHAQPILGALPALQQQAIEEGVGDPACFTAVRATTLNVLLNLLLYPLITTGVGAAILEPAAWIRYCYAWVGLGVALALLEALVRLREGVLHGLPTDRWRCRGGWYGWLLAKFVAPFVRQLTPIATQGTVAVNGFHAEGFEDKLERERRYGEVYSLKEQGNGYLLRFEFPRRVPQSAVKERFGLPDDMPDYDYELSFRNGFFVVTGRVVDTNLRRLASVSPGFPPDFTTTVELPKPASAFKHRLRDKTLEVVLLRH
jgi:hypothetical protein